MAVGANRRLIEGHLSANRIHCDRNVFCCETQWLLVRNAMAVGAKRNGCWCRLHWLIVHKRHLFEGHLDGAFQSLQSHRLLMRNAMAVGAKCHGCWCETQWLMVHIAHLFESHLYGLLLAQRRPQRLHIRVEQQNGDGSALVVRNWGCSRHTAVITREEVAATQGSRGCTQRLRRGR